MYREVLVDAISNKELSQKITEKIYIIEHSLILIAIISENSLEIFQNSTKEQEEFC